MGRHSTSVLHYDNNYYHHRQEIDMNENNNVRSWSPPHHETNGGRPTPVPHVGVERPRRLLPKLGRKPITVAFVLVVVLASLLIWSVYHAGELRHKIESKCLTPDCIKIASRMLENLEPNADPCEDFSKFACNNFKRHNTVPDDYYAKNLLQEMQEAMFGEMRFLLEEPVVENEEHEVKQIKRLYQSCMNEPEDDEGVDEEMMSNSKPVAALYELIVELTGHQWPILASQTLTKVDEMLLEEKLARMYLHRVQPFFQVVVNLNRTSSLYALHVFPGQPVIELLHYGSMIPIGENSTLDDGDDPPPLAQLSGNVTLVLYRKFMIDMIEAFAHINFRDGHTRNLMEARQEAAVSRKRIETEVDEMLSFEIQLFNLTRDPLQSAIDNCTAEDNNEAMEECLNHMAYLNVSYADLSTQIPGIKLDVFFDLAFKAVGTNRSVYMLFHSRDFYRKLESLLKATDERVMMNYLGWAIMANYLPYLGQPFRSLSVDYQSKAIVVDNDSPDSPPMAIKFFASQWKQCVSISCDKLKLPAISLYLQKKWPLFDARSARIRQLFDMMKSMFLRIVTRQPWITSKWLRDAFYARVKSIRSNVGVPELMRNRSYIDAIFAELDIDADGELIRNIGLLNRHEAVVEMGKINTRSTMTTEWLFQPLDANAFYDLNNNDLIIPIGIVRPPMVYLEVPRYLELSFLGIVIGHEIAHSVDMNSRKQFSNRSELSGNTPFLNGYKRKAQCFVDVYSSFRIEEVKRNVNGALTLEENLGDFASVQTAFAVFQELPAHERLRLPGLDNFTLEQVFFINYAQLWCDVSNQAGLVKVLLDNHSPGRFRTNGVLMNTVAFSEAFSCPLGSPMNPKTKCDLWTMQ